jgi:bacteriocin-like protein
MSETNDSSKLGRAPQVRELSDNELDAVSGGDVPVTTILRDIHDTRAATINNLKG